MRLKPIINWIIIAGVIALQYPAEAQVIYVSGTIATNTTWVADTVKMVGDVNVLNGATLTIPAGTYVEAQFYCHFNILGRILAVGTPSDSIIFTVNDTAGLHLIGNDYGSWGGFDFFYTSPTNDTSQFAYCVIRYCKKYSGSSDGGAFNFKQFSKAHIEHCSIVDNVSSFDGAGISCLYANPVVRHNFIARNRSAAHGGGVCYMGDSVAITNFSNNTLYRNHSFL
jgi:hypothetical protein